MDQAQDIKKLAGKRVLIFQQRGWGINIGHFLAKKLQAGGCRLAALTLKRTTHEFMINQKEVKYDLIINNDEIMSRPKDYLQGDNFSLEEICDELGVDSIWPIVRTLRHHVMSYKDKYYYSYKQNVPDEEIIDYVMAVYKYIKEFFDKFDPQIIIATNFVTLPHIMFNLYASKRGVKMITVTDSKISGVYIFSHNYNDDQGPFFDQVDVLNNNKAESPNRAKAKKYIQEFRQNFKYPDYAHLDAPITGRRSFKKKIRHLLSPYYHIFRWYTKKPINYLESTGVTLDWRPPRIILRDHYYHDWYIRVMKKFDYYPFEKVKKFVYFPLQFQPEMAIDVIAPYFNNQIEVARLVAMSLPGDYTLVVKEHPDMIGLRAPSYLEKIARTVNVKLIDYRFSSEEVLKRADLVICPSCTTIAEAAFLNKPVIQLGNLGTTMKLPNVFKCTDMTILSKKIKEVLKADLNTPEYERRLENYVTAAYDVGIILNYCEIWEKGDKEKLGLLLECFEKEIIKNIKYDLRFNNHQNKLLDLI